MSSFSATVIKKAIPGIWWSAGHSSIRTLRSRSLQVLYNGSTHWICVFNYDRYRSENNTCYILDSLSSGKITRNVEKKIYALLLCKEPVIKVVINWVQQQGNGVLDIYCYSIFIVHAVQYANMKEKIQWLNV